MPIGECLENRQGDLKLKNPTRDSPKVIQARATVESLKERWFGRIRSATQFGALYALAQLAAIGSSFVALHLLSQEEFAIYTIAFSAFTILNLIADSGVTSGVLALGGKVWTDPQALGSVVDAGRRIRRRNAIVSLVLVMPSLVWSASSIGASPWQIILLAMAVVVAFDAGFRGQLLAVPLRLHQEVRPVQLGELIGNASRVGLLVVALLLIPTALVGVFCLGASLILATWWYSSKSASLVSKNARANPQAELTLRANVRKIMAHNVFYAYSGQIVLFIASGFGEASTVAELGALARLGQVMGIIGSLASLVFAPRFAKLSRRADLQVFAARCFLFTGMICCGFIGMSAFLPGTLLLLLGNSYSQLSAELALYSLVVTIHAMTTIASSLIHARAWLVDSWITISTNLTLMIAGALLFELDTLRGLLLFSLLIAPANLIIYVLMLWRKLRTDGDLK